MNKNTVVMLVLTVAMLVMPGCRPRDVQAGPAMNPATETANAQASERDALTRQFVLQTGIVEGRMVYLGVGGAIDGLVNPDLVVEAGDTVHVTLINQDGLPHDLSIPDFQVKTPLITGKGTSTEILFSTGKDRAGSYAYFCTTSGHRQAGMQGWVIVN